MEKNKNQPILVTGTHRSGTTWVGKILSCTPNLAYIHEPFNPINSTPYFSSGIFDKWFTEVNFCNSEGYHTAFQNLFDHKGNCREFFLSAPNYQNAKYVLKAYINIAKWKIRDTRVLLKDPIAIMSVDWLCKEFNTRVICVFRHPAAFVSSVLQKKWDFNFDNFLNQPSLIEGKLSEYRSDIEKANASSDPILRMATLWNCLNSVLLMESKRNPNGIITVRHEDISLEPVKYFEHIFKFINEPMTQNVLNEIECTTMGNYSKNSSNIHDVTRDSRKNIWVWRDRLTSRQIDDIRTLTEPVSQQIYENPSWWADGL